MDGFELCRRVKQIADLPIIVLSAVDASEAKVSALELYAEDYVTKPFDPDELVARIQRVLRRAVGGQPADLARRWRVEVDLTARQLTTPSGNQQLTPTEARLLQVLASAIDRVVRTEELLDRVWTRCRRSRSVLPVGHRSPPPPQARARSRQAALPDHRARDRATASARAAPPPREPRRCLAAGSGCVSSSACSWRSCRRSSCSSVRCCSPSPCCARWTRTWLRSS